MNLNNISILENSPYTTPEEKEELVDTERVMDVFKEIRDYGLNHYERS